MPNKPPSRGEIYENLGIIFVLGQKAYAKNEKLQKKIGHLTADLITSEALVADGLEEIQALSKENVELKEKVANLEKANASLDTDVRRLYKEKAKLEEALSFAQQHDGS